MRPAFFEARFFEVTPLPKTVAIVPAAGAGVRMGGGRAKQYLHLEDRPILAVTLEALQKCAMLDAIVLVVPSKDVRYCQKEIVEKFCIFKVKKSGFGR